MSHRPSCVLHAAGETLSKAPRARQYASVASRDRASLNDQGRSPESPEPAPPICQTSITSAARCAKTALICRGSSSVGTDHTTGATATERRRPRACNTRLSDADFESSFVARNTTGGTVDTATALPSGWHPDGTGVRWWNGTAWSQQAIPLPRRSPKIVQSTSLDLQTVRLSYQPPPPLLFPSPQVGREEQLQRASAERHTSTVGSLNCPMTASRKKRRLCLAGVIGAATQPRSARRSRRSRTARVPCRFSASATRSRRRATSRRSPAEANEANAELQPRVACAGLGG